MSNYTQGDWKIRFYESNVVGVDVCFSIIGERGSTICGGQSQEHLGEGFILEDECRANAHLLRASKDLFQALRGLVDDIEGLMAESSGVTGLHLNGDVASWSELDEGGRFERLSCLSAARYALAKALGESEQAEQIEEAA